MGTNRCISKNVVMKSREAYNYLHEWLDKQQLEDTSLSIGPKGSYFARCGSTWISHGLPKDLMTKLERNKDEFTPVHVALGLHGSWVVLWSDGDLSWKLKNSYPGLAQSDALTGGVGQVLFVALSPFEEDGYFIAGENGCSFNANLSSRKDCEKLQTLMDDYLRVRAKRDNVTFNYPTKINGMVQNVSVTPTTYEKRAGDSILEIWRQRRHMLLRKENVPLIGAGAVL
ncbi:uncharacterized protein N0V89_004816 [Didymosphaeria variabile]|uniref:Uncharacterized protein n=1 Tax=Didymosphaeria variabile TaxID=1932322 RepID=A0A9W8XT83_9PLEO|nr:uncharacterized protein N0V89_004816 [Didymosphaeria variabile]KAJ4356780.1 hypothetical protein N0V89_004816 [Didymosphaeria variabile]